jgi:hypothetical protein
MIKNTGEAFADIITGKPIPIDQYVIVNDYIYDATALHQWILETIDKSDKKIQFSDPSRRQISYSELLKIFDKSKYKMSKHEYMNYIEKLDERRKRDNNRLDELQLLEKRKILKIKQLNQELRQIEKEQDKIKTDFIEESRVKRENFLRKTREPIHIAHYDEYNFPWDR